MLKLLIHLRARIRYGWLLRNGRSELHLSIWDEQGNELREGTPAYEDLVLPYLYCSLSAYYTRQSHRWRFCRRIRKNTPHALDSAQDSYTQLEFDF